MKQLLRAAALLNQRHVLLELAPGCGVRQVHGSLPLGGHVARNAFSASAFSSVYP
jgi:hypothetical protein